MLVSVLVSVWEVEVVAVEVIVRVAVEVAVVVVVGLIIGDEMAVTLVAQQPY